MGKCLGNLDLGHLKNFWADNHGFRCILAVFTRHVTREKQIEAARAAGCPDSWRNGCQYPSYHQAVMVKKGQFKRIWENNIRHLHDIYMTIYSVEKSTE